LDLVKALYRCVQLEATAWNIHKQNLRRQQQFVPLRNAKQIHFQSNNH
jgi:hypothetical protein